MTAHRPTSAARRDAYASVSTADAAAAAAYSDLQQRLIQTFNHQLRTPLTSLVCHAELLLELDATLPAAAQRSLEAIGRASENLKTSLRLLSALLLPDSLTERGQVAVDINLLVRGLVCVLGEQPHPRGVTMLVTGDVVAATIADATLVRRSILELLENAQAHAPDDSIVEVSTLVDERFVSVTIRDRGRGIPGDQREHLMATLHDARHPMTLGGQLGLSIAAATAAAHRGELVLEENPGGGLAASLRIGRDPPGCLGTLQVGPQHGR